MEVRSRTRKSSRTDVAMIALLIVNKGIQSCVDGFVKNVYRSEGKEEKRKKNEDVA